MRIELATEITMAPWPRSLDERDAQTETECTRIFIYRHTINEPDYEAGTWQSPRAFHPPQVVLRSH
jgi:hypothetical protein